MEQELIINVIPFEVPVHQPQFAFYTSKREGYSPIHKDDLKGIIEDHITDIEIEDGNWLYTDFNPAKDHAILLTINLSESVYFAQHYYRHLIRQYFLGIADVMRNNFTNEIEVWFHDKQKSNAKFNLYNQFTL